MQSDGIYPFDCFYKLTGFCRKMFSFDRVQADYKVNFFYVNQLTIRNLNVFSLKEIFEKGLHIC